MKPKFNWKNKELLTTLVQQSECSADVLRSIGLITTGSNYKTLNKYITKYDISILHFTSNQPKNFTTIPLSEILNGKHPHYKTTLLKNRLLREGIKENKCELCGQDEMWNNLKLVMQLDHINGNSNDHHLTNLRMLCPNCHTQTPTYAGKNNPLTGTGKYNPKYGNQQDYLEGKEKEYKTTQIKYINNILQSGIDFSKIGWVKKVAVIINQKPQRVGKWMTLMMPDFYNSCCYKRKNRV